jgi:hypothetical protein
MKTKSLSIATPIAIPDVGDNVIGFLLLRLKRIILPGKFPQVRSLIKEGTPCRLKK